MRPLTRGGVASMKSPIFSSDAYTRIQDEVRDLLNAHEDFLPASTAGSTRAVGDAIEGILGDHFQEILKELSAE